MEQIIDKLKDEARRSWHGAEGERRAERLESFLRPMLAEYAAALGLAEPDVLAAIEGRRTYSAINYYQRANFPELSGVRIFANRAEALAAMPSRQFRCPACAGVSTDPYECDSGKKLKGKACDWKSYGLFRTVGKGFRFTIREGFLEQPRVEEIFMPLEFESTGVGAASASS